MEFILSVWQFYLLEPMFTVGFVLGNMFFGMLYINYYGREHWQHHSRYTIMQIVIITLAIIALGSALWPLTIPGYIVHWVWKYPCYWIGGIILKRLNKPTID